MIRVIKINRFYSSHRPVTLSQNVTSILKDLNLIGENDKDIAPHKESTEVEVVYRQLNLLTHKGQFQLKLVDQLKLYNNSHNFKSFYRLLTKLAFLHDDVPSIHVYNQIFRSIFLMISDKKSTPVSNSLAQFSLNLAHECTQIGLNEQSFHYLDKIVASSGLLQLQLQYQIILDKFNYFNISYLISSGQYERCVDFFNLTWNQELESTDNLLVDLNIYKLILLSLDRLDYKQVIKFLEIIKNYSKLLVRSDVWSKIVVSAAMDKNYNMCLYCYDEFIKTNLNNFSETLLFKICEVFAENGDMTKTIELMDSMKLIFEFEAVDSRMVSIILEGYCSSTVSEGYRHSWNALNKFEDIQLEKQYFTNICFYYPVLKSAKAINKIVADLELLNAKDQLKDIIYYTIFKKICNDTNLTGISFLIQELVNNGNVDQIFKNYNIIINSISRSNSSKIFTLNFFNILESHNINLTTKEYYMLLKNSVFGNGCDNYSLTKYLITKQLDQYHDLTPAQMNLLGDLQDNDILNFLQIYLSNNLQNQKTKGYKKLLTFDLEKDILKNNGRIDNRSKGGKHNRYNYKYDIENNELLSSL